MNLADKIGLKIYNYGIRKRNEYVRNPEKKKQQAKKVARYLISVGSNIANDVTSGQDQMFLFKMPQDQWQPKHRRKRKR